MISRAFEAGWGGAIWKTIGEPIQNVTSRLATLNNNGRKMMGINNIELITDRPVEVNLREIYEVKRRYPENALIVSLMYEMSRQSWHEIVKRVEDAGADGLELNFGCPHGMSERGMGSAVGQVPEYIKMATSWVKETATVPVIVKLTPNVTDILHPGRMAVAGGADGLSLINTINSVMGVDLENFSPLPSVDGMGTHGGYCGPAVKPIALHMLSSLAKDPLLANVHLSGIGGIASWSDAAEFIALGATTVQICTAVMHYGYRIVEDLSDGLARYLDSKGMNSVSELRGAALPQLTTWGGLNLDYRSIAQIDYEKCISCNLCYIACQDGAHQAIAIDSGKPEIIEKECVGCNLCEMVCPVDSCITMVESRT